MKNKINLIEYKTEKSIKKQKMKNKKQKLKK